MLWNNTQNYVHLSELKKIVFTQATRKYTENILWKIEKRVYHRFNWWYDCVEDNETEWRGLRGKLFKLILKKKTTFETTTKGRHAMHSIRERNSFFPHFLYFKLISKL